jgi:hypothetical protein
VFQAPARAETVGLGLLLNPEGSRLFPQQIIVPRHAGKPDPRWHIFDWRYIDRDASGAKFRFFFYSGEEWPARFALDQVPQHISELIGRFGGYVPSQRFNYILFTSLREFQQANVFDISEGVLGVTSTTELTMALPYFGDAEMFRHISTHEMTHQFQVQKIADKSGEGLQAASQAYTPLWFIEGMAEYYSLRGIDPETKMFVRDLMLYPDKRKGHEIPKFFEEKALNFIQVYKMGQARMDFMETDLGAGSIQKILDATASEKAATSFEKLFDDQMHIPPDKVEERWKAYLNRVYLPQADLLTQSMDSFKKVDDVPDTMDEFDVSPDETLVAVRQIDELSGVTSVYVIDLERGNRRVEAIHDAQAGAMSLSFMQRPAIALSNHRVAIIAETLAGPELITREIKRNAAGDIYLGRDRRIKLHDHGIVQAESPAIDTTATKIAVIGLKPNGWKGIYLMDLDHNNHGEFVELFSEPYNFRTLAWEKGQGGGILFSSNKTESGRYGLFVIDPVTHTTRRLPGTEGEILWPDGAADRLVFQSWNSGSSQIHLLEQGRELILTSAKTGLIQPRLRGSTLYVVGFRSGRYRLFQMPFPPPPPEVKLAAKTPLTGYPPPANGIHTPGEPWRPTLATLPEHDVNVYRPFTTSDARRLDYLTGFFGTGGAGGVAAQGSDLMRDYTLGGQFFFLGSIKYSDIIFFLSSNRGRTKWTAGGYHTSQTRLDTEFDSDNVTRTHLHREYGVLGALQYPFGPFSHMDFETRVAGVTRSDYYDPTQTFNDAWNSENPGLELQITPILRWGYDHILYEAFSGPLKGFGTLIEAETDYFPQRAGVNERLRLDLSYYIQAVGRTIVALQALGGVTLGGRFKDPFYISSDDIMRGYPFGDDRLRGNNFAAARAELRFPIGTSFGFPPLRGIFAYDIGSAFVTKAEFQEKLSTSYSTGLALNIPPLAINFLFSFPVRIATGPPVSAPVFHFTFRYLYL